MNSQELLEKGTRFLRNCFQEAMDRHYENEIAFAVAHQKEQDAISAVAAFTDLKVSDTEILRLLSSYFDVDSIAEATELISIVRSHNQVNRLRDFCIDSGMSRVETLNHMKENHVRETIQADSKLQNMAVDKLKNYFDKHS